MSVSFPAGFIRGITQLAVAFILLAPVTVTAAPADPVFDLLGFACDVTEVRAPCGPATVISSSTIGENETVTYENGDYVVSGVTYVENGGKLVMRNATFHFTNSSAGIYVREGGTLEVHDSDLIGEDGSMYQISAGRDSFFDMQRSSMTRGGGIAIWTNHTTFQDNELRDIDYALRLQDVVVDIIGSTITSDRNPVVENGGGSFYSGNSFIGGFTCYTGTRSTPTLSGNTFRDCHTGISTSSSGGNILGNSMEDQAHPPGSGINILNAMSTTTIRDNDITNYGQGIHVEDATVIIASNTVTGNVYDAIHILRADDSVLDGNHVGSNGWDGIRIYDSHNVTISNMTFIDDTLVVFESETITIRDSIVRGARILATRVVNISIVNTSIIDSVQEGIHFGEVENGVIDTVTVTNASYHGLYLYRSDAEVTSSTIQAGAMHGLILTQSTIAMTDVAVQNNGDDGIRATESVFTLTDVVIAGNGGEGIHFDPNVDWATLATSTGTGVTIRDNADRGLWNVRGNRIALTASTFEGNGIAGVFNGGPETIVLEDNYWGSATGPTHAANPGGTGDVIDGNVDYTPYRTSPP